MKTSTSPTPPQRDLATENAWLRTSVGQQIVKTRESVLSTPSTAGHQIPTIHTGRSIYHMVKLSHKCTAPGCTSSDALNFPPIAEASAVLPVNTTLKKAEVHHNAHPSPKSGQNANYAV